MNHTISFILPLCPATANGPRLRLRTTPRQVLSFHSTMSGHSKWANIRVKKTAQDAKRGKVFTKHAKLIEIAARKGGGDPETNSALRAAMENARAENVPNANIERAMKKGMGEGGDSQMEEVLYACYLPGGIACLIECLTDNRNRTISSLRAIIEKNGGKWANVGSVAFL